MDVQPQWYRDFFEGVVVDLWTQATTPEQTEEEVEFVARRLGAAPGARLLDVPCGNGRHARRLAKRGYEMAGVDGSEQFIAAARKHAADEGLVIDWRVADMRDLPWEAELDGALCMGNSFGYLERDANRDFFGAVGRALRPGGRFVLQTGVAAESLLPNLEEREWWRIGDMLFLIENHYRPELSCLDTEYVFVRDGRTESRWSRHHVFTVAELTSWLGESDLLVEALFSGTDDEPYQAGSPMLLLVAVRT